MFTKLFGGKSTYTISEFAYRADSMSLGYVEDGEFETVKRVDIDESEIVIHRGEDIWVEVLHNTFGVEVPDVDTDWRVAIFDGDTLLGVTRLSDDIQAGEVIDIEDCGIELSIQDIPSSSLDLFAVEVPVGDEYRNI